MNKYNMRYTILGIQQKQMIKYGLDLSDALLIDTLKGMFASPSFERIIEDGTTYIWVNQTFLLDYIPILGSRATLQRRLNKLEELGFAKRIVKNKKGDKKGKFSYIALLPKIDILTEYNTINNPKNDIEDRDLLDKNSDEENNSSSDMPVDNLNSNNDKKVIHSQEKTIDNTDKADDIAIVDTMSQSETTPCIKMKQPLYQDETTLVSKRDNKDTLNKDTLNIDTHSFIQDNENKKSNGNKEKAKKENEGLNEDRKKLEDILNRLDLIDFKDSPVNDLAIKRAIETLWYKKSINSNGLTVTNRQIRNDLKFLTNDHLVNATNIFIKESERQEIKNRIGYLAVCIYNSIFDIDMSIHNQIHNN